MKEQRVEVAAYSGHRGEEAPRSFILANEKIMVVEIRGQWIEEDAAGRKRKRYFRIKGSDRQIHLLSYEEKTGEWYLE